MSKTTRWVIPDLAGKGNRLRIVTVQAAVKVRIEEWIVAADLYQGRIFRPINKGDRIAGECIAEEKAIWHVVVHYGRRHPVAVVGISDPGSYFGN